MEKVNFHLWARVAGALLLGACMACAVSSCATSALPTTQPRTLIIFYDTDAGREALLDAARRYGSAVIYQYRNFRSMAVSVPRGKKLWRAVRYYKRVKGVLSVLEDRVQTLH